MIIHRILLVKFILCFESFFFIISVIIMIWSCSINGIIIILYLLWNSTFEVILGLTISSTARFLDYWFLFYYFYTYWIFFSNSSFSDYLGRIHSGSSFISSNSISFTMHSLGIIGFPRRIYDYSMIFFKFQWFNSIGLIGITLSIISLLFIFIYYSLINNKYYPLFLNCLIIGLKYIHCR